MTESPWTRLLALLIPLCTGACLAAPPSVDDVFAEPPAITADGELLRQVDGIDTAGMRQVASGMARARAPAP